MEENKKDKKIIVDCAYWYNTYPGKIIAELDGKMYLIPTRNRKSNNLSDFRTVKQVIEKECMRELPDYDYIAWGLEKRSGYNITLGRAITENELEKLKNELELTDNDMSSKPFEVKKGAIYGEYAKKYMCINIRVPENKAINIEQKLKSKGIEAANINDQIVQIRVPD